MRNAGGWWDSFHSSHPTCAPPDITKAIYRINMPPLTLTVAPVM